MKKRYEKTAKNIIRKAKSMLEKLPSREPARNFYLGKIAAAEEILKASSREESLPPST